MKSNAITLGLLTVIFTSQAYAGALRISPIRLDLDENQRATTLTLANQSAESENLQIRAFQWVQDDHGKDSLKETNDIILSPAVISIPGNGTFNVRVVRTAVEPVKTELAYRVIIDELPKPVDERKNATGVNMLLRSSLPLFIGNSDVMGKQEALVSDENGVCTVKVINTGSRHILLEKLSITSQNNGESYPVMVNPVNGYVLPGKSKTYSVDRAKSCSKNTWLIKTKINGKDVSL